MKHVAQSMVIGGGFVCACGEPWADGECSTCCASCHRPMVREGVKAIRCGECWHAWRWKWQLVLHDARVYWQMTKGGWRWWQTLQRVSFRRPSRIWVCPCCAHDL